MAKTRDNNIQEISSYELTDYNKDTMGVDDTPNPLMGNIVPTNYNTETQGTSIGGYRTNYDRSKYDPAQIFTYDLQNLESIRESNQGVLDALGRSTANLIGKTGLNVIGGLGGTAYGILDAIGNGEFRRVWDNDFNRAVDSASESVGDYFRVYKSGDYEDMNILQKAFLHPVQFADEFMDALSFTTGAVVTDMLSSGMASGLVAARALKYFKNIDKASKAANVGENLGSLSQRFMQGMGNGATLTRQLATGAAWEGSVEARHTAKQMEEDMIREWQEANPNQEMPDEVLEDIIQRTTDAGMFTFLTNIALVGGSNLVQFPRIFGSSYNTARKGASGRISYDRGLGRYVDDAAENLTRGQRRARNVATALRNTFMEGLVEEGGQGVISGTASAYWDRKNDDEAKSNVDRFLTAFGQSFIDTYTTKEGWNEIGMGMLIGSLGAPGRGMLSVLGRDSKLGAEGFNEDGTRRELWTGGIAGAFQERDQRDQEIASMVERINQNTDFMKAAKAHYDFLTTSNSLQKDQDAFLDAGDVFNYQNIKDDQLHSYISSRIEAGLNEDLDTLLEQLESTSPEDFYAAFRGEELEGDTAISDIDKRNFKRDSIKSLKDRISNTREAYKLVDRNYQGSNLELREALIYSLATAKNLDAREESMNQDLTDLSRGYINNNNIRNTSNVPATHAIRILEESLKNEDLTEAEKTNIQNTITRAKALLEQVKGKQITVGEAELLAEFIENRPTEATTNLEEIVTLLDDSRKLRFRREHFIDLYNQLFTEEGQKAFEEHQEAVRVAKEKAAKEAEAAERRRKEFEKQAKANKAAEKRQQDIKKKAEAAKETKEETSSTEDDPFADIQTAQLLDEEGNPVEQSLEEGRLLTKEERIEDLNSRWQEELDKLKAVYDQQKLNDPNTPEPVAERDAIHKRFNAELDAINLEFEESLIKDEEVTDATVAALEASTEETSTETGLTSEEKSVLDILDAQEAVATTKEIKNDGAILPYTPSFVERFRQKVKDILDITRKRKVANTVISLNIDYVENVLGDTGLRRDAYNIWDQYDESGDLMINENFDSRLQDPKQFKIGNTLNIIFPTFEQIAERGIGELTGDTYTRDRYNQDIVSIENFPIAFTDAQGNIVGFLPTTDNVRRRVAEDNLPLEIQANIDLRTNLFENQDRNYTVTITDKSTGTPMFSQNKRSIYNALGDGTRLSEGVKIGVYKNGRLRDGLTTTINGNILPEGVRPEEAFEEGRVYIVVPTAKEGQSFTFEADVNRVSPEAANAVVRMIQLFRANPEFKRDADLISERDYLSSEIDFTDFQSFITAVQSILYVDEGANMFQIDTKNAKIRLGITKDKIFDLNEFMTDESVRQSVANELTKRYPAIRLTNFGNRFDTFELNEEGSLAHRDYRNYFDYINEKELITTNIHGRPIEGTDKLYFTAQSVIEIDDNNIKESPRQIEATETIEEAQAARPVETARVNPLGARKPVKRVKSDTENDNDVLFNMDNLTVEEQVKNLMRICGTG